MKKISLTIMIAVLSILFVNLAAAADVSKTWSCAYGGLDHCENFETCRDQAGEDCINVGFVRPFYYASESDWKKSVSLNFGVSNPGNYSCSVSVYENGYGYYNGPQLNENSKVYVNNQYIFTTTDGACNSGSSCYSSHMQISTFSFNKSLSSNNVLYLLAQESHALAGVSINCNKLCSASTEVCDGIDNDCDGQIDEGLFRSSNQLGICSQNQQYCSVGTWLNGTNNIIPQNEACNQLDDDCDGLVDEGIANIFSGTDVGECRQEIRSCVSGVFQITQTGINSTTEVCNQLDDDCDGQIDEGNVCEVCSNGGTRNFIFNNFCSGLNVLSNVSYQQCVNNAWVSFSTNGVFNRSCSGSLNLEDSYCSGDNLVSNWSQPVCSSGNCGRSYFVNQTVCEYGCSGNTCNLNEGYPTCSVDSLAFNNGSTIFSLNNNYFNFPGTYVLVGQADSNSIDFDLTAVNYNLTGFSTFSLASSSTSWTSWNSNEYLFANGISTVCCQATSQKCIGVGNCVDRTSDIECKSFCMDNQDPVVLINSVGNMSNWSSSIFNWSWNSYDVGCAGINFSNLIVQDSNGTVIQNLSDYSLNYLISTGLIANHSYLLSLNVTDNAGNIGSASASITLSNSLLPLVCSPSREICDGLDNDCDGSIDEGNVCKDDDDDDSTSGGSCKSCNNTPIKSYSSISMDDNRSILLNNVNLSENNKTIAGKNYNSFAFKDSFMFLWLFLIILLILLVILVLKRRA